MRISMAVIEMGRNLRQAHLLSVNLLRDVLSEAQRNRVDRHG
jgi:hypothetical protein